MDLKKFDFPAHNAIFHITKGLIFNRTIAFRVRAIFPDKNDKNIPLTTGARNLTRILKRLGFRTAVISGGFQFFTDRLKDDLGLDYAFANQLEIVDGVVTGRTKGVVVDGERKAQLLEEIAEREGITLDQVIAIGDGANDLPMLGKAGLGIAFNAKARVREQADTHINQQGLDSILYLLGLSEREMAEISGD